MVPAYGSTGFRDSIYLWIFLKQSLKGRGNLVSLGANGRVKRSRSVGTIRHLKVPLERYSGKKKYFHAPSPQYQCSYSRLFECHKARPRQYESKYPYRATSSSYLPTSPTESCIPT
ncbi:hypothetical protein M0804_005538 [Polistes exclamans]|nr:hypothetical protein M0804_005538 [Polistes exclamans]